MALDPDVAAQVAHLFDATLAQVLSGAVAGPPAAGRMARPDVETRDGTVPGSGGPVPVRVHRPAGDVGGLLPALVWAHGGGWRFGGVDMPEADSVGQVVAATLPGMVVSVGYRLAPDHTFPAPLDDVVDVLRWAQSPDARSQGIDPERVAIGGASAGAHLALAAALAHVEAGSRPAALLLAYPVTDPMGGPYPDARPPECPPLLWLDREAIGGMFEALVDDVAQPPAAAVPGRADPTGLPPTLVATAEYDALAPQALAFVHRAQVSGVDVTLHEVDGLLHGYLNTVGDSAAADSALHRHVSWLRSTLGGAGPGVGIGPTNL